MEWKVKKINVSIHNTEVSDLERSCIWWGEVEGYVYEMFTIGNSWEGFESRLCYSHFYAKQWNAKVLSVKIRHTTVQACVGENVTTSLLLDWYL